VPLDDAQAVEWQLAAARAGDVSALMYLGPRHEQGLGVPRDLAKAAEQYRRAAQNGSALGMCYLGDMYSFGNGVEQNAGEAYKWYRAALLAKPPKRPIRPVDMSTLAGTARQNCERSFNNTARSLAAAARSEAEQQAREWLATVTYETAP
jgi:TPR repeat protein